MSELDPVVQEFVADFSGYVGPMQESVGAAKEFGAANKEAMDSVKGSADVLAEESAALQAFSDEQKAAAGAAADMVAAQDKLKTAAAEAKDQISQLAGIQSTAGKDSAEYAGQLDIATGAMQRETAAAKELKDLQEQQAAASKDASAKVVESNAAAATSAEESASAQEKSTGAADAAAGASGRLKIAAVATAVGMAYAVDQASKFQDSTTHLVTDAGESAKNLAMVQQGILSVSAATGTSAADITNAMYHIESSGFHGAAGLAILKTTAEGAKVGGADLDTTAKALMGTLTAYYGTSMTAAQATKNSTVVMNELIATVGAGDMRMQDLAGAIHSVAPVAAASGISLAQVGGAIATMTAQGMTADQVTQNLGHVITSLSNPTNVMTTEMAQFGLKSVDVAHNLGKTGLSGTLQELSDVVLKQMGPSGLVLLNTMNQSKTAAADATAMWYKLPPAANDLATAVMNGSVTTKQYTDALKAMDPVQANLVKQWDTVYLKSQGFNDALKSGSSTAQTYAAAMSKMTGGQVGLNVSLMLTGKHMSDLKAATAAITAEGKKSADQVDNWSTIQSTFKFKMDQSKASLQDTAIALGSALLPAVTAILTPLSHFLAMIASNKAASIALAIVVGGILAGALGLTLAKGLKDASEGIKAAGDGIEWLIGKMTASKAATVASTAATEASTAVQEASAVASESQIASTEALTAAKEASVGATEAATVAQTEMDVAMDANPIGLIIIAIMALVAAAIYLATHWKQVWGDVKNWALDAWHFIDGEVIQPIERGIADLVGWIESHWKLLATILATVLLGPIGGLIVFIATHWKQFEDLTSHVISTVTGFFEKLPGEILRVLANLPGDMLHMGMSIIDGLLNGVTAEAGRLFSYIGSIGSGISHVFSSVLSIFSPSRVFYDHGVNTLRGYREGLEAEASQVNNTMGEIGRSIAASGPPVLSLAYSGAPSGTLPASTASSGGSGATGGDGNVSVYVDGQKLFTVLQSQLYRYNIRNSGAVTGVVVPGVAA